VKLLKIITIAGALVALLVVAINRSTGGWWVTQKADAPGRFLRVTANYVYLGTPIKLDFVLTCGGTLTTYRDGDRSVDVWGGPELYGVRLPDGKALVLSTTGYCSAREAYLFAPGFLPVVVIFDDPQRLTQGWAYMSEAAYERPNSPLKFTEATVSLLPKVEAALLYKNQTTNIVNAFGNAGPFALPPDVQTPPEVELRVGRQCVGWVRLPIAESKRHRVRELWPSSRPKYWLADIPNADFWKLAAEVRHGDGFAYAWSLGSGPGLPRRNVRDAYERLFAPRFPGIVTYVAPQFRAPEHQKLRYAVEVALQSNFEGLYYCGGPWPSRAQKDLFEPSSPDYFNGGPSIQPASFTINGKTPKNWPPLNQVTGQFMDHVPNGTIFFENDEYYIKKHEIYIANEIRDQRHDN
jgi:hypothetical protein